jgi:hypothetical protein
MRYAVFTGPLTVLGVIVDDHIYSNDQPMYFVIDKGSSGTEFRAMARCGSSTDALN